MSPHVPPQASSCVRLSGSEVVLASKLCLSYDGVVFLQCYAGLCDMSACEWTSVSVGLRLHS